MPNSADRPVETVALLHASKAPTGRALCSACYELAKLLHQQRLF